MIPVDVIIQGHDVILKTGDDNVVYKSEINNFASNTGLTIKNVRFPLESERVFYCPLSELSTTFVCGNSFKTTMLEFNAANPEDVIIIMDFNGVDEISESFIDTYTKFLLETNHKIITINMNTQMSNAFGYFITSNIYGVEE